ncbi:MAG TPA: protein kinase [Gemmataceae bacterium]|jgi:serine/threonine protein kinase
MADLLAQDAERLVECLAEEMAQRWREGEQPCVEDYLTRYPQLCDQPEAALELLYEEIHHRQEQGQEIRADELLRRFPHWRREVRALLECHHLLTPSLAGPQFPTVGETLGEFHLLAELGYGTTSRVFLATQPSLANRPVVLKLGPRGGCEHLSLARLQHTHIVPLHSAHDFPSRRLSALCLPYFGGSTLDRILVALRDLSPVQRSGRDLMAALEFGERPALAGWWSLNQPADAGRSPSKLSDFLSRLSYVQAVCWIAACLCDALHYAHERGLLHLDLKPSNVLLAGDGQPMLLDFHLARPPVPAGSPAPAWMGGTPGYMAPEQQAALDSVARRENVVVAVDVQADLYSLGVLLYELLGGELPVACSSSRSLRRLNPCVSVGLADVVTRCLMPEPGRRYSSAADLAADLRRHLADLPLRGVANRSWSERWRKWRRRRRHALPLLILLSAITAAGCFALAHVSRQSNKAQAALREGQNFLDQLRYAEALNTFKHGIALVEDLPFGTDLKQHLHDRLREAECGQAIHELHLFCERVRPLYNAVTLPEAHARTVESHCRTIWEQREVIVERLRPRPGSELERQLRADLIDMALVSANLRVRLAAPNELAAARQQALKILDEAEALFGTSNELRRERQFHAQALNKQS